MGKRESAAPLAHRGDDLALTCRSPAGIPSRPAAGRAADRAYAVDPGYAVD